MQTIMSNTMNMSLSRAAPLSSAKRCNALASRPARLVRGNRLSVRAETDKSVESQTPNVNRNKTENIEAGNLSNENAEKRADIGKTREPTPAGKGTPVDVFPVCDYAVEVLVDELCHLHAEAQAFDGPAPETINGRLAMLGVVTCLGAEFSTNVGIQEQIAKAPFSILGTFVIISLASYIPIFRYNCCIGSNLFEHGGAAADKVQAQLNSMLAVYLLQRIQLCGFSMRSFFNCKC